MPIEPTIPISLPFWLLSLTPIVVLLVLLVVARWTAAQAGPIGYLTAALLGLLFFQMPIDTLAIGTAKGFWDAVFILYIVWTALALYELVRAAHVFDVFREGIQEFTPNRLVQFFAFGLVFVLFLQSTAGFGTPIAVVAPLLVGLGIKPLYAVSLALIGHVWGNSYGGLAISWIAMNLVVPVTQPTVTLLVSSLLLAIAVAASALTLAIVFGGRRALKDAWLLLVALIALYGLGQMAIAPFIPELAAIVPATLGLGAIYWLGRMPRYQEEMAGDVRQEILAEGDGELGADDGRPRPEAATGGGEAGRRPSLAIGFIPYYGLVGFMLLGLALTQFVPALAGIGLGFGFPATATGYGIAQEATPVYSGLNPIDHPGTAILLSVILGYVVFASRGYIPRDEYKPLLRRVAKNAVPTSVAIVGFLAMSSTMEHSGQIYVLAQGIAAVLSPALYAGAAVLIGILGAFMTSSNTASNILFSPLHVEAAQALGINQGLVLGGQMAGGAYGNAIAPANVALGTGTARIAGQEGAVLRQTLPWALGVGLLGALIVVGLYFVPGLQVPGGVAP